MNRIWIISTLASLVLAACSSSSSTPNTTAFASASPETQKTEASPVASNQPQAGFKELKAVIANTTREVETNNFAKAQKEFGGFEEYWSKVEDGVKAKFAETYKEIENDVDNITNGLRASNPNKTKMIADLQSLSKTLNSYQ